jgi:hypothetical protein
MRTWRVIVDWGMGLGDGTVDWEWDCGIWNETVDWEWGLRLWTGEWDCGLKQENGTADWDWGMGMWTGRRMRGNGHVLNRGTRDSIHIRPLTYYIYTRTHTNTHTKTQNSWDLVTCLITQNTINSILHERLYNKQKVIPSKSPVHTNDPLKQWSTKSKV